jgi:DNA-binding beta-propeller fold protein YncE
MKQNRSTFALLIGLAMGGLQMDSVFAQQPEAAAAPAPLTLTRRIPLPGVIGRLDHMGIDAKRGRLILAALGNDTIEIVDLNGMKVVHSIPGQSRPQGVLHMPDSDRLLAANEGGKTNIYRADNFELVKALDVPDGDNARYDLDAKLAYVASEGGITVIDASTLQIAGTIKLQEEPNSFQLETKGTRLFANLPRYDSIAVVDRKTLQVTATWKGTDTHTNFSMALDEANHRLFAAFRNPPMVGVFDMAAGKMVATFGSLSDVDNIYYDTARKRIYQSGADGFVGAWQQLDPDHYELIAKVPSRVGARTSFMVFTRGKPSAFIAGAPRDASTGAELLSYQLLP